jgi:hypothetical protein
MNQVRGIMLLAVGGYALYAGYRMHTGQHAWLAYGLGVLAIAVGLWRIFRKEPTRLA